MKKARDHFIFLSYQLIGENLLFKKLVWIFYVKVLVPTVAIYLKIKHKNLIDIQLRNSLLDQKNFNPLLSDIDTCLIVVNDTNSKVLIKDFLKIKKFFIMLDFPEIYTQSEFFDYQEIKKSNSWKIIDTFWNIRKINWCKRSIIQNSSELNELKMNRAIKRSFNKIMNKNIDPEKTQFYLSDLKYLSILFDTTKKDIAVCCYSRFLDMIDDVSIFFEVSREQFLYFNILLPEYTLEATDRDLCTPFFLECREKMWTFERLITVSSIRLKEAMNEDCSGHYQWLERLEKNSLRS